MSSYYTEDKALASPISLLEKNGLSVGADGVHQHFSGFLFIISLLEILRCN